MGSIESYFRFEGYKIDRIFYETIPHVNFLGVKANLPPEGWKTEIGIRQPTFFKSTKQYVGGLNITLNYPNPGTQKIESTAETGQLQDIVKLSIGISGVFTVEEGRFDKATEESLIKIQIPALLFPYLRSAITSILAHAGLGSVLFPLINIYELAKNANLIITEME